MFDPEQVGARAPAAGRARLSRSSACASPPRGARGRLASSGWELVDGFDLVAEANHATLDDVCAETASVNEWAKESGSGEFLEVSARFGQPAAEALDGADPKPSADKAVEGDAARDDVAPCL